MYKIGIVSDTHGLLRDEIINQLKTCNAILHAGDINKVEIIEALSKIAPLYIVRGNNDKGDWAEKLPHHLYFELAGKTFYMVHQKKDVPKTLENVDFVIYGHSHQYNYSEEKNMIWLNPGSCGKRRFGLPITMVCVIFDENKMVIEKVDIEI